MHVNKRLSCLDFDGDGPRIGRVRLVRQTPLGLVPRPPEELSKVFAARPDVAADLRRIEPHLARMCHLMNIGDFCLAGLAAGQLKIHPLFPADVDAANAADALLKAAVDDPKHPGYPAKTPDDKGGQFRPKDDEPGVSFVDRRALKLRQLSQRRGFRAALRRVLTWKRLLRLTEKNAVAALTEEVPILDAATDASALAEDLSFIEEVAAEVRDGEAASTFLEQSTGELSDIVVSADNRGFASFDAFKKIDLEKVFGSAGDGFDYHHIVEQGPNLGAIPNEILQSTENIVRIPKLLHEEINSTYAKAQDFGGRWISPRDYLRGRSYEEQRAFGLKVLRDIGILRQGL